MIYAIDLIEKQLMKATKQYKNSLNNLQQIDVYKTVTSFYHFCFKLQPIFLYRLYRLQNRGHVHLVAVDKDIPVTYSAIC